MGIVFIHTANIHDTVAGIIPAYDNCVEYHNIQAFCGDVAIEKHSRKMFL